MASLTIPPAGVRPVTLDNMSSHTAPASVDINKGQVIRVDATTGKWVKAAGNNAANAGTKRFIAINTVKAGQALTGVRGGLVDLGVAALDGINFGAPIYLSDTPGEMTATVGESTTATIMGYVMPIFTGPTVNRLLMQEW